MNKQRKSSPDPKRKTVPHPEGAYAEFLHLTYGLRAGKADSGRLRLWPTGKRAATEVSNVEIGQIGEFLSSGGLEVVGNENRMWSDGYEERFWNPALLPGLGSDLNDLPGHDWANLAYAAKSDGHEEAHRLAEAASVHLRGASLRLMHVSEWYHQMLQYAHLRGHGPKVRFSNMDLFHLLLDCHSLLVELASARDHISSFAGRIIDGSLRTQRHAQLVRQSHRLKEPLKTIVEAASDPSPRTLTLAHIGRYRDLIVHQYPISGFSEFGFETVELGIGLPHPLLGVKFDIIANPLSGSEDKFDCLRAFKAMLRVVFKYSRDIIALSPIATRMPELKSLSVKRLPMRRIDYP